MPQISRELNTSYLVEGSGQKIGDQLMLSIQLIDGRGDRHLWSRQYNRNANDIFSLQQEVAEDIASEIEAIITPQEQERIEKIPTENLEAYDLFLKGLERFRAGTSEGLVDAIGWFNKALDLDPEFARALADVSLSYAFLDLYQQEKQYTAEAGEYADRALLIDPTLPQGLVAKALYIMNTGSFPEAVPYLEKALEYNPNSSIVINMLSEYYANYLPDTEKYLEYALRGINLDMGSRDSSEISISYLHIANALVQSGFVDEADDYIGRSMAYDPDNHYAVLVNAYVQFAQNGNLEQTRETLLDLYRSDTTRIDVLLELGKIHYYMREFATASAYYGTFLERKKLFGLAIYPAEDAKIAVTMSEVGRSSLADSLFEAYRAYAETDQSLYRDLSLAMYHSYQGNEEKALEYLEAFSREDRYHLWIILFLEMDPLADPISQLSRYQQLLAQIKVSFWDRTVNFFRKHLK